MEAPKIIFEDDDITVVSKPEGLVVNKSETTAVGETVQEWHWSRLGEVALGTGEFWDKGGVVHRLDRDTSGVMVLAKTAAAYENLKLQFLGRKVEKKYIAAVYGRLDPDEGSLSAPVVRNPVKRSKFMVGSDLSRMAVTDWKVIAKKSEACLVELTPHTGRTHQLRVHMRHLNHPIMGDSVYGVRRQYEADKIRCPRLFLHATELKFAHPGSGEVVVFRDELPQVLVKAWELVN